MAQFYSLDEAARVLGMSPEELKSKLVDHALVVSDEARTRNLIPGSTVLHERPVGAGGV